MVSKVAQIISNPDFTLIDHFINSPKLNNPFGLLLRVNLLPRTFKNGRRMVGADKTKELWQPPIFSTLSVALTLSTFLESGRLKLQ